MHKSILNSWIYQRIWGNYTSDMYMCKWYNNAPYVDVFGVSCPEVFHPELQTCFQPGHWCTSFVTYADGGSTNGRNV